MAKYPYGEIGTAIDRSLIQQLNKNFDEVEQDMRGVVEPLQAIIDGNFDNAALLAEFEVRAEETLAEIAPEFYEFQQETKDQFERIQKTVKYSQLGSIAALKLALANGTYVDLDESIEINEILYLTNSRIYSLNGSAITLDVNGGVEVRNNSDYIAIPIRVKEGTIFQGDALKITIDEERYPSAAYLNAHVIRPDIKLNSGVGSNAIVIESDNFGFWGVTIDKPHVNLAETALRYRFKKVTSWITGTNIIQLDGERFKYYLRDEFPVGFNPEVNFAGNRIIDPKVQPNALTKEVFRDRGKNVYTNIWPFDLHTPSNKEVGVNKFGIIAGTVTNMYNDKGPSYSDISVIQATSLDYHRIGFIYGTVTSFMAKLKFYNLKGDVGDVVLTMDVNHQLTAKSSNQAILDVLEFYSASRVTDDGDYYDEIYLKRKAVGATGLRWAFYENYLLSREVTSPMTFTIAEMTGQPLVKGLAAVDGGVFPSYGVSDSGLNEYGRYIRFNDGTQICWRDDKDVLGLSVANGATYGFVDQPFPMPFVAKPQATVDGYVTANDGVRSNIALHKGLTTLTSWGSPYFVNNLGSTITRVLSMSYYAIGRWK